MPIRYLDSEERRRSGALGDATFPVRDTPLSGLRKSVFETRGKVRVRAEGQRVRRGAVEVSVEGRVVRIHEVDATGERGRVESIQLPRGVDASRVRTEFTDGKLTLTFRKASRDRAPGRRRSRAGRWDARPLDTELSFRPAPPEIELSFRHPGDPQVAEMSFPTELSFRHPGDPQVGKPPRPPDEDD